MRILQVIQKPQLRGAEIFACQLSNHLLDKGIDVTLVTIFSGDSQLPFNGKTIHLDRPVSTRLYDLKGWKSFSKIVKRINPDIIQANAADTLKFTISSKMFFQWNVPVVFRNANKMGDFIDSKLKYNLNRFLVSKVARVISVSKECEKDFLKTFNMDPNRVCTVEIGVEKKTIGNTSSDLEQIFSKGDVIAHIGGFVAEKNHKGLIEIFNKVQEKFPSTQLILIGKGKLLEKAKLQVEELELENNVHFLGYRNDILEILSNSKLFVMPSYIEGLPAVILEAMYCKTPVVAYNVGGISEVVRNNETGWLINKNDEESFKNSILDILSGNQSVSGIVTEAKKMIDKEFLNLKIAERFLYEYKKLAKTEK